MSNPEETIQNREAWLHSFAREFIPVIRQRTSLTPVDYKLSCGFPSRGARSNKNRRIGECWHIPGHKHREIFVHPQIGDSYEAAETVAHELLHAALKPGVGHRKPFSQAAKKLGLEGKPTSTFAGDELKEQFKTIIEKIGKYPHEALPVGYGGPPEKSRNLKAVCPMCGYIVRTTQKWFDEAGAPICPTCMVQMMEGEWEADDPLFAADTSVEYKVRPLETKAGDKRIGKYDPRWSIRMNRRGREINWFIIDLGPDMETVEMEIDGSIQKIVKAVMGTVTPRLTPAESRADAISLLEALRDGSMTYKDIETSDDDETLDTEDLDWLNDDEDEVPDVEETEEDLLFTWERQRGLTINDIDPEAERTKREGWVKE